MTWPDHIRSVLRLDGSLVEQIAEGRDLRRPTGIAAVVILVGALIYGYAFGAWHSPLQGVYAAVKFVVVIAAVVLSCAGINALMGMLASARLSFHQSTACVLIALATTVALLAAFSPIVLYFVAATPSSESLVGLSYGEFAVKRAFELTRTFLGFHIVLIAACGIVGNIRLYQLLQKIMGSRRAAMRTVAMWLIVDGLAGAQVSWILRPYLCQPNLELHFFNTDAFRGNFLEGLWLIASGAPSSFLVSCVVGTAMVAALGISFVRAAAARTPVGGEIRPEGLALRRFRDQPPIVVPYAAVSVGPVLFVGGRTEVELDLRRSNLGLPQRLVLSFREDTQAERFHDDLTRAQARASQEIGPFRDLLGER